MLIIILEIVGIIGYLYLSWRTLKENYQEEDIIAFSWVALLLFLIGGREVYGLAHLELWSGKINNWLEFWKMGEMNFFGALGLWTLFAILIAKDKSWKICAFLEDSLRSVVFLSICLAVILQNWEIVAALGGATLLSVPMKKKYRSLIWFKSGKKGFIFFWFFIMFWLILAIVSKVWWLLGFSLLFGGGLFMLAYDKFSK